MPDLIVVNARGVDLSQRFAHSEAIVGSPALAAETIVAQIQIASGLTVVSGVQLWGSVSFTVGTSGTAATLRIRQTNVSGTVKGTSAAFTVAATNLVGFPLTTFDTTPGDAQIYVLTLQITAGAATSTVAQTQLSALVV